MKKGDELRALEAVKIKAGKYRGFVGIAKKVMADSALIHIEGVRDGVGVIATVEIKLKNLGRNHG